MKFKDKVKKYRTENKMTQVEFSKILGVSRTMLGDIETGRALGSIKFISNLSDKTGIDMNYWVKGNDAELEPNHKKYDGLDTAINAMLESEIIGPDSKIPESYYKLLITIIEQEIKIEQKKK